MSAACLLLGLWLPRLWPYIPLVILCEFTLLWLSYVPETSPSLAVHERAYVGALATLLPMVQVLFARALVLGLCFFVSVISVDPKLSLALHAYVRALATMLPMVQVKVVEWFCNRVGFACGGGG